MFLRDIGLYPKKEYDYDANGNLIYEGFTNASASVNDPEWLILKHFYDSNNNRIATRVADNRVKYDKIWTNRNSYNYTTSDNQPPIIDSVIWNDDDHYENNSYTLTINAHDPDSGDSIDDYTVSCDDGNVTITQDGINPNQFHITYPHYNEDVTVTYTVTVTDNHGDNTITNFNKIIHHISINTSRGVFAGGYNNLNTIDYIVISTLGDAQDFGDLIIERYHLTATSNGTNDRGIFAGGWNNSSTFFNIIEYITISTLGDAQDFGDLILTRRNLAATSNGTNDRGIFGGGYNNSYLNIIDYITISTLGDAQDFGDLAIRKFALAATSNNTNDRGIFAGGYSSNDFNIIDYITISTLGNTLDFGDLTIARRALAGVSNSINNRGVFAGGYNGNNINAIDYITISVLSNAQDFGDLTIIRRGSAGTSNGIGDRGVFGGGYSNDNVNTIDYITITTLGDALDFGDLSISRSWIGSTSNV